VKKFSDLGIKPTEDKKIFNCPQVSISDIVNTEIEVIDFIPDIKTKFGDSRYLVKVQQDGVLEKFFTNSASIKSVLDKIPKEEFPFATTIKATKCGNGKIYQFT
jgi:hypothetical protein